MNRTDLFTAIVAARPDRGDAVYLERRGDSYDWRPVPVGDTHAGMPTPGSPDPDVWMCFSATWPDDPARMQPFFDDLLAELESMADKSDRCRWPLDQPWPHSH